MVTGPGVRGLYIGLLRPGAAGVAGVDVHRAGLEGQLIRRAADAGGAAGFAARPDRKRVAVGAQGDRGAELVTGPGVRGLYIGLLRPGAGGTGENVHRAGLEGQLIRRAADAGSTAVFERRPDRKRVAVGAQGDRGAELVTGPGVRGLYIGLLRPGAGGTGENVHRAGLEGQLIRRAADDGSTAVFERRSDRKRVAVGAKGDRGAELVTGPGVRGLYIGLLRPGAGGTGENVHRAGLEGQLIRRAADAGSTAVFERRSDRKRVAVGAQGDRGAELVTGPGVRGLYIGLLRPGAGGTGENVHRAGLEGQLIRRAADADAAAGFGRRPDRKRVAVGAQGNRNAELVKVSGVRGLDVGLQPADGRHVFGHASAGVEKHQPGDRRVRQE